jgi:hypothetical protein
MTEVAWNPFYGAPVYPAERYTALARRIGAILKTDNDVLLCRPRRWWRSKPLRPALPDLAFPR